MQRGWRSGWQTQEGERGGGIGGIDWVDHCLIHLRPHCPIFHQCRIGRICRIHSRLHRRNLRWYGNGTSCQICSRSTRWRQCRHAGRRASGGVTLVSLWGMSGMQTNFFAMPYSLAKMTWRPKTTQQQQHQQQ